MTDYTASEAKEMTRYGILLCEISKREGSDMATLKDIQAKIDALTAVLIDKDIIEFDAMLHYYCKYLENYMVDYPDYLFTSANHH